MGLDSVVPGGAIILLCRKVQVTSLYPRLSRGDLDLPRRRESRESLLLLGFLLYEEDP